MTVAKVGGVLELNLRTEGDALHRKLVVRQRDLLNRCVKAGLDLDGELTRLGLTYDDLRYSADGAPRSRGTKLKDLSEFQQKRHGIPVMSFFSGAGGLDLGFETAGFDVIGAVEHNELFCETLRLNAPGRPVIGPPSATGDVSDVAGLVESLRSEVRLPKRFEGVFIGGPPCQPFSIAANQRFSKSGDNFKRIGFAHSTSGNLLFDYIELIAMFRPRAFLIENVPGLAEIDGGEQIGKAILLLQKAGYSVSPPAILNTANYGVPQRRRRMFLVGLRGKNLFRFPPPVSRALPCGPVLGKPIGDAQNHVTRKHTADSILRYMALGYGERDQLGRVDRLDPELPSKTIIAGGVKGGGRSHLHPHIPRTLSVRECARLQTFPDDYVFCGPSARQFTQVGNAVPPVLAAQLAHEMWLQAFSRG